MSHALPLHQEVLLLALNDRKGTFSSGLYLYSVTGAMVSELLLNEFIAAADDKDRTVSIVKDEPTGHTLLDELMGKIRSSSKPRGLSHWVSQAAKIKELPHRIAQQMCDKGVLERDDKKVLWLFTKRTYPELDGTFEDEIRERMSEVMFNAAATPDARTSVLIALASHASLLRPNFAQEELDQHSERIKALANGDILAADATRETIEAVRAAIIVATIVPMMAATVATSNG